MHQEIRMFHLGIFSGFRVPKSQYSHVGLRNVLFLSNLVSLTIGMVTITGNDFEIQSTQPHTLDLRLSNIPESLLYTVLECYKGNLQYLTHYNITELGILKIIQICGSSCLLYTSDAADE